MKLKVFILVTAFAALWHSAAAQEQVNMKFGKPTKEEMQMTVYEPEPEAEAVVLCRLTDVEYTVQSVGFLVDYSEKVRIKVLQDGGERFAKVIVPFQENMSVGNNIGGSKITAMSLPKPGGSSKSYFEGEGVSMTEEIFGADGDESVESIKATAFNMEGSKVVKTTLKRSDIVKTKIDDQNYQMEFTVPNVKKGTVIEYEYKIHSQLFWQLRDWFAQGEIPVVYAKLDMNIPNYLIFNIEDHGIQRLTYTCTMGSLKFKVVSDPLANPMTVNTNHYVYEGRNLKGMPRDKYVWNTQDYCAGITAELKQYRLPGMSQMDFARTWEQIDEMILTSDDLGIHLNDHSPLIDALNEAKIKDIADQQERAAAVCRLVMKNVKWNGKYELSPGPAAETLNKRSGSNADINLLLIQTLHDAGLEAAPVMLRERTKGLMPYNFPSIRKMTTYVVGIMLNNSTNVFVDASSEGGYLNVLPEQLLVERARIVSKKKVNPWVNLQKVVRSQANTTIDATLGTDGTLSGTQTTIHRGLSALHYRQQAGKTDEFSPEATEETTYARQGEVSNGTISIQPLTSQLVSLVPFTTDTRMMPVEFPSESSQQVVINITLPEGYTLAEVPQPVVASTPDKGVSGRFVVTHSGRKVQVTYQFNISKMTQPQQNYDSLHGIFDMFSKCAQQSLVFKKN